MSPLRLWISCGLLCGLLSFPMPDRSEAHSKEITQCRENIVYQKADLVAGPILLDSGLVVEAYDTNGDKKPDVVVFSHFKGDGTHSEHPIFWMVDIDFDGVEDAVYIDKRGLGVCTDIVLYEDLYGPGPSHQFYNSKKPLNMDMGGRL